MKDDLEVLPPGRNRPLRRVPRPSPFGTKVNQRQENRQHIRSLRGELPASVPSALFSTSDESVFFQCPESHREDPRAHPRRLSTQFVEPLSPTECDVHHDEKRPLASQHAPARLNRVRQEVELDPDAPRLRGDEVPTVLLCFAYGAK